MADDNADAADSLAELLRMAGCEVAVAYEGFAVLPVAQGFGPDACLLDVRMPGLDGWEIARRLRAGAGGTPLLLVALTGLSSPEAAGRSADAGFDRHVVKPAAPGDLLDVLADFILRPALAAA